MSGRATWKQHLKETQQERQLHPEDKALVAPALQKYQGATVWPRSGRALVVRDYSKLCPPLMNTRFACICKLDLVLLCMYSREECSPEKSMNLQQLHSSACMHRLSTGRFVNGSVLPVFIWKMLCSLLHRFRSL